MSIDSAKLVSEQLKPFTKNLMSLISEFEKVMVDIAMSLPKIEEDVDDNLLEARELMKFIFSSEKETNKFGIKFGLESFRDHLESAIQLLKNIEVSDKKLFEDLSSSINTSSDILENLQNILTVSENLKVFAINSICHSRRVGTSGKGYQIIAGEFIKLSEQIGNGTNQIISIGKDLDVLINQDMIPKLKSHEAFSSESMEKLTRDAESIISNANMSVDNFSRILGDLLDRIGALKTPFKDIMVDLQIQDIIQQQMIHLNDSIRDILQVIDTFSIQSDDEASLLTLVKVLVVNAESQMTRIGDELVELVNKLEIHFRLVADTIDDIKQDKDFFSEIVISEEGSDSKGSVVERIFHVPHEMISALSDNLTMIHDQKLDVLDSFKNIVGKMTEENESAQTIPAIIRMINNLLTLARIERARYQLDISDLADSSGGFQDSINSFADIVVQIEESNTQIVDSYKESESIFNSQLDQYQIIRNDLRSSKSFIEKTEKLFTENFETIVNISDELFEEVNQYINLFDVIRRLQKDLRNDINVCAQLRDTVDKQLQELGGDVPFEQFQYKDLVLQKIIKKFTVAQERDTMMAQFDSLKIEESVSNNITLF
ncbi:hypothetical protein [Spirochaeta cellobiosiphila]|uniref:hypothetical protein n=1 Tax=Spirochaeta cellobiosiphila TaxID=504483 RepID=UPI00041B4562|nr:hypothetical protein [Spirochaeta cellobiosiphila]